MSQNSLKPKILLVISSLAGRGGERSVLSLGQGFLEAGCEVHILCFSATQDYDKNPSLNYHVLTSKRWYDKLISREMRYQRMAKDFDRYVAESIGDCQLVLANLIQQHRILYHSQLDNVVYVIRNTLSKEYDKAIRKNPKKVLNRFQKIYKKNPCVCVSQGVERDLNMTLGDIGHTTTIYNSFDESQMKIMADKYLPDLDDYIVHVGTFSHAKAHDVLLKAYAKALQRSNNTYPLILLGKGKLLEPMKQLAKELSIDDKVHFLGFNKNPYPYIKHAKGMVLSSRFEGFVRVVLEALALGTPVVSTDCPSGPNEVLSAKHLVSVDDVDGLADKIVQLMNNPTEFIAPFDDRFLPKNIAEQYLDYFSIDKIIH